MEIGLDLPTDPVVPFTTEKPCSSYKELTKDLGSAPFPPQGVRLSLTRVVIKRHSHSTGALLVRNKNLSLAPHIPHQISLESKLQNLSRTRSAKKNCSGWRNCHCDIRFCSSCDCSGLEIKNTNRAVDTLAFRPIATTSHRLRRLISSRHGPSVVVECSAMTGMCFVVGEISSSI